MRNAFRFFIASLLLANLAGAERLYLSGHDAGDAVPWEFFCTANRNSGVWTNLPVPSCWDVQGFGSLNYDRDSEEALNEKGLYRHAFKLPGAWKNQRLFLVFDGVMTDAEVKLNGESVGPVHQGSFYRFKYEVTKLARCDAENKLEVTVSKHSADESVNRAERNADFWVFGGIFRPVWIEAVPQQFINRVAIDAKHDGSFAMDYSVNGEGKADGVSVSILDANGKTAGDLKLATPFSVTGTVRGSVANPKLWTAESPNLYTAVVQLKQGGTVVHELRQRFGFRTIEVRERDGVYVNGQRVILKGACRHSFWPTTGRALAETNHLQDIALMQEMNMNAVRMSHYPPDERFLELCDEKGLYVLDELCGWQKFYSTEVGRKLVREMVERDVNHPSVIFWDNGNEGGFNRELDGDYAPLDPQHRVVLHPWENFGGINTKHYPKFDGFKSSLESGDLVMPTEFLHGLFDGGMGAGLEDYWRVLVQHTNGVGGFLWALVDEGVMRPDTGTMDVFGNRAPDGVVGPFREKEGSFFTVKEVWSPVVVQRPAKIESGIQLDVENRFDFTNLSDCKFQWQLRGFGATPAFAVIAEGMLVSPDVKPHSSGKLPAVALPDAFIKEADALALSAFDPKGRRIWTWVWPMKPAAQIAERMVPVRSISAQLAAGQIKSGSAVATFEPANVLKSVSVGTNIFSISSIASSALLRWSAMKDGWFELDYEYAAVSNAAIAGVAFSYPETKMKKKTWLGQGPYRVWRNRIAGETLGVWETAYNRTATGWSGWDYPEFGGWFAQVRWAKIETKDGVITVVIPEEDTFLRVGTPVTPDKKTCMNTWIDFPPGDIAITRDVPATGSKFHAAKDSGPMATTPLATGRVHGTVYLRFE